MTVAAESPPPQGLYRIALDQFEGPLDLLLHLIQKHELDIFDIPISFITARYLEYLEWMRTLDLDVAAEYLLMAATLAHIKSRMLLPDTPADEDGALDPEAVEGEDPRAALVRRLLEYQKFRAAAEELASREIAGRDVFPRGPQDVAEAPGVAPLAPMQVFSLLDAFEKLLKKRKLTISHEVTTERVSIAERIQEIVERLKTLRSSRFDELFDTVQTVIELVVTFLAVLEMTRLRMTRIYQTAPTEPLHVTLVLVEVGEIQAVDDYR